MSTLLRSIAAAIVLLAPVALAQSQTLQVEVSEDMNRFAFDQSKTYEDGFPAHGSGFVTQGYVYPAGTLDGSNGVNADGSAEFPDLVIGEWICYGYMINDAAHATSGAWVVSTQIINLEREHGAQSIVTTGYEFADDSPAVRAVAGGTGAYAEVRGEAVQVFTGLNASEGVVLSIELTLTGVSIEDAAIDDRDLTAAFGYPSLDLLHAAQSGGAQSFLWQGGEWQDGVWQAQR
jgi:hypothetical protein